MTNDDEDRVAHAVLALVCDRPGRIGRLRAARIVGGYDTTEEDNQYDKYMTAATWTLAPLVDLIDELIEGGLVEQTIGARPTLVLTRHGFRALEAMDVMVNDVVSEMS